MYKTISILLFLFIFVHKPVAAQMDNSLIQDSIGFLHDGNERVGLSIYNNTFFKNNEYFEDLIEGYTLFGSQLKTELFYQINSNVRIQAGVYARKDFGNDKFSKIAPLISIKVHKNGYSAIMGNLEGNVTHQLAEPIYNYERIILNHLENGLQFKANKNKFWGDTWINWEVQQYLNSNFKEQLSGGHSSKTTLYTSGDGWKFKLPIQGLISHKGGQLDTDTSSLKTLVNIGTGLIIEYDKPSPLAFIKSYRSENYYFIFNDLSPKKDLNFKNGTGLFLNMSAISKYNIGVSLSYWSGHNFLSSRGGDIFKSEASIYGKQGYTEKYRNLVFARLFYQHKIFDALNVDVRFEPFYDLNKNLLEYSYSVYFTFKRDLSFINLTERKSEEE